MIPDDFFKYIEYVGCAIKLHSIINWIDLGRPKFELKTDSILSVCESFG